jgi:hypothetical protein
MSPVEQQQRQHLLMAAPGPALIVERSHRPGARYVRYIARVGAHVLGRHFAPPECDHADYLALIEALYERHLERGHAQHGATPDAGASHRPPLRLVP